LEGAKSGRVGRRGTKRRGEGGVGREGRKVGDAKGLLDRERGRLDSNEEDSREAV
jgi:hypothetical protein